MAHAQGRNPVLYERRDGSHELKTPVTNIKGYTQLLQSNFATRNDEDAAIIQRLGNQVNRLTTLIGNLLDTTKISEGKLALYPESFQLNDLIREQVDELQRLSTHHQLIFLAGQIRPIKADKERIGQVLTNLLSNAIKYSPAMGLGLYICAGIILRHQGSIAVEGAEGGGSVFTVLLPYISS